MAAAWRWRPAWRGRRQLGRSAILAVAAARLKVQRQHDGSSGNNVVLAAETWHMLTIILMVTMMTIIDCSFVAVKGGMGV